MPREKVTHLVPVVAQSLYELEGHRDIGKEEFRQLPLDAILPRVSPDLRPLDQAHVQDLLQSIEAIGMLQPLVVCRRLHLLCGRHRLAALRLMQPKGEPAVPVTVRVMLNVDSVESPMDALAAEIAENEKRRDYTAQEIALIVARLKAAGFMLRKGRPRADERPMGRALDRREEHAAYPADPVSAAAARKCEILRH